MDALYTFGDNITHYKTESVHFLGLMNSATKRVWGLGCRAEGFRFGVCRGIARRRWYFATRLCRVHRIMATMYLQSYAY